MEETETHSETMEGYNSKQAAPLKLTTISEKLIGLRSTRSPNHDDLCPRILKEAAMKKADAIQNS